MTAPDLVTVTIDSREIEVPKGMGIVETAARGGIEIPVFCYEPRLGAPIGACRMCLCDVEGMPKPMAACTMTAQDGMVVHTSQTSQKAYDAQHAVLEFILVNHPLDCPVCDKGGECPLQDLTFRYGPGATRMRFPKRTYDKPIPISPLIALDRERCILCYRCTRFSEEIAEDGQLVAENRGAQSMIATFDGHPYRAPFSGNVTELCPVGALTSTEYRFDARPWEIQNVPTVCGLCPVGCNVHATTREGKAKRILSRNHPELDGGWLCDKGRYAFPHLQARDRIVEPLKRVRRRGFEPISWEAAIDEVERLLRNAPGHTLIALSGSETCEQAYALAKLLRQGAGSHGAVLPEETSDALDAFRAPLSTIGAAEFVVVLGDDPPVERAPVVDLWIKAARRRGAEVVSIGCAGSVKSAPGQTADACRELADPGHELGARLRSSDRAVLIWSGPGGHGGATLAALAQELGFADKPGCAAFRLPATANGRGVAEAWAAAAETDSANPQPIRLLIVSGDEAAADPNVRALAEHAEAVIAITMFQGLAVGWADLVLPATSYLERDGTYMNLEGRLQRLRRAVIPPGPDELAWIATLAERFGVELSPYAAHVFDELGRVAYGGTGFADVGERAALGPRTPAHPVEVPATPEPPTVGGGPLHLLRYRPLFSGPAVERVETLQFQRPPREVELAPDDAALRGIEAGDTVRLSSNGTSVDLRATISKALRPGVVRAAEEHVPALQGGVEASKAPGNREVSG
jgi:NADH-quinone oxidoreductase subunit G